MDGVLHKSARPARSNPTLDKIAQEAEAQVPEQLRGEFTSIMVAGGKLMWSQEMTEERAAFDQAMKQIGDVPRVVSHAVLKIVSIIQNESKRDKPLDAIGIAAPIFMAHILQYVESRHGMAVTNEIIDETAQLMQVNLLKMYGVTEQQVQELIRSRSQGPTQEGQEPAPGQSAVPDAGDQEEQGGVE